MASVIHPIPPRPSSSPLSYPKARPQIRTGDVLLFQGRSRISRFIQWGSNSCYSHAGLAAWWDDRLLVFQATGTGACILPASSAVDAYDGQVDWFVVRDDVRAKVSAAHLMTTALDMLGRSYAHWGLFGLVFRMGLGRFRGRADGDAAPDSVFCSQYVSYCYRMAGHDLVPGTDDGSTSPGDLARSPDLRLMGALKADNAEKKRRAAEKKLPGGPAREFK